LSGLRAQTIGAAVESTYRTALLLGMLVTIIAGTSVAGVTVVAREDARNTEIALMLHAELIEPERDVEDAWVEERGEMAHSARTLELWRDGESVPRGEGKSELAAWQGVERCGFDEVGGVTQRLCSVVAHHMTVIVGAPLAPLVEEMVQIGGAIALAALASIGLAFVLGRRALGRKLAPLSRFTARLAQLPSRTTAELVHAELAPSSGVTEIDELALAFRGLIERVAAMLEREQRFTADAAHELRSPLTRVRAQLELYQRENAGEGNAPALSAAIRTVDELSRMVEMLLALARDEAAAGDAVDLGDVVNAVVARLGADAARVTVEVSDSAQPLVRGDATLLELALGNLIDNALKYSGGRVTISILLGDPLELVVADEGPGLSYADAQQVRLPFVRGGTRPSSVRGAGIGLALVDHVARLHSGALTLANRDPSGLRASLRLPAWRPRART